MKYGSTFTSLKVIGLSGVSGVAVRLLVLIPTRNQVSGLEHGNAITLRPDPGLIVMVPVKTRRNVTHPNVQVKCQKISFVFTLYAYVRIHFTDM